MPLWTPDEKLSYIYAFIKHDGRDIELDFWQDDFIRNRSRFICLLKSRQTGFSFVVALKGLVKTLDPARRKYTRQFVSYNEDDAKEKIRYAREFYESIPARFKKRLVHSTATSLELEDEGGKSTSRLISLPCRPPRGKSGDVCLDEFAICLPRLSNEIYTAASFCTLRQGCIEIGSTPLGTIGKFHEICTDKKAYPAFDRYVIPWWYSAVMCRDVGRAAAEAANMPTEDRVREFGTERLAEIYGNSTEEDFRQECECEFVDSAQSYIPLDLIYANTPGRREEDLPPEAETSGGNDEDYFNFGREIEIRAFDDPDEAILAYNPERHGSPLFLGYDVARKRDAAAFYIIGIRGGKRASFLRHEKIGMSFEEQKDVFRRLMKGLPVYRACMDCTGMGMPLFEELHKEFGERVEGVNFTMRTKEQMAISVRLSLERREFLLENSRDFHAQIHSIKRVAAGGGFRYDAERNERGHADGFWAWALASLAFEGAQNAGFYAEYARKKYANVPGYRQENPPDNFPKSPSRGKPLDSVLRRIANGGRR